MQLSKFVRQANIFVPTALMEIKDVDYSVFDYKTLSGQRAVTEIIDPDKSWQTGCTITPGSNEGYFVTLSIFQGSRHYPLLAIRVHGSISDAGKICEACAHYIEDIVWH